MKSILLMLSVFFFTVTLWGDDATGKWSGSIKTDTGQTFPFYLELKQDGAKLSGLAGPEENKDQRPILNGKTEGSILYFQVAGGDGSGSEYLIFELHLKNDELMGNMKRESPKGPQEWKASFKRAPPQ